ncbi:MAG: ComF family protein [Oscillospiraceae bacterium]|jgi:ComF family protein|nr:ComF family protein [Oscillospiraceae bacterium]
MARSHPDHDREAPRKRFSPLIIQLRSLFFPSGAICISCGALRVDMAAHGLCHDCEEALVPLEAPFCPRCGRPGWSMVCPDCSVARPTALDARISAYAYRDTAASLVRALKYQHVDQAARALVDGMIACRPRGTFDALVPVPLHRRRMRQRGFNQAETLCQALSKITGLPIWPGLTRIHPTRTQTRLNHKQRQDNVRGAFAADAADIPLLKGASLLLVDDVMTTGATAESCAQELKAAGAARVVLWTATRAALLTD